MDACREEQRRYRASWAYEFRDIYCERRLRNTVVSGNKLYEPYKPKETLPGVVFIDPNEVDEHALLATNIKKYIDDNALRFIMGNKKVSSDWDAYVSGLGSLKLDDYLENIQKAIDNRSKNCRQVIVAGLPGQGPCNDN